MAQEHKVKGRQLLELPKADADKFLKSFDVVVCVCEGVLWNNLDPIPDTGLGVMALKSAGKTLKFLSLNSISTDSEYLMRLRSIGVNDVKPNDIITPGKVMLNYLKAYYGSLRVFSLCSFELNDTLRSNGLKIETMDPVAYCSENEIIHKIIPDSKVSAVIYDLNFNLTYSHLAKAQQYLRHDNCSFIVSYLDTFIPITKNFSTIATAGITNILRESTGKEPISLGRTGNILGEDIISNCGVRDPSRVLLIGDNLFNDMPFAQRFGFQTLFVLTGVSKLNEIHMLLEQKPDYVTPHIADFEMFFSKFGVPNM